MKWFFSIFFIVISSTTLALDKPLFDKTYGPKNELGPMYQWKVRCSEDPITDKKECLLSKWTRNKLDGLSIIEIHPFGNRGQFQMRINASNWQKMISKYTNAEKSKIIVQLRVDKNKVLEREQVYSELILSLDSLLKRSETNKFLPEEDFENANFLEELKKGKTLFLRFSDGINKSDNEINLSQFKEAITTLETRCSSYGLFSDRKLPKNIYP